MAGSDWTCSSCSASNPSSASACPACGTPKPEGPPPLPSAGSGFELKRIDCPSCGGAIDLMPVVSGGQVRCASCGTVLDTSSDELKVLAQHVASATVPGSAIRIGQECEFHGVRYRVTGRIRYVERDWHWDEWFLVAADGTIRYLEEDGRHFRLLAPFTPKEPPPLPDVQGRSMVRIDGRPCTVVERGQARLESFEGQLPWRATPGDEVGYCDLSRGTERLAVEWSKREIEFYRGLSLPHPKAAAAFGVGTLFPHGVPRDDDDEEDVSLASGSSGGGVQLTPAQSCGCMIFLLVVFILCGLMDGCSGGSSTYRGGRTSFSGGK